MKEENFRKQYTENENRWPAYSILEEKGLLAERIEKASEHLENCNLCPRLCGVNRLEGELGFCRAPARPVVASHQPHFGEEQPLVGQNGSGTIFFAHCNLRCIFCQNWPIAHEGRGRVESEEKLAERMLELQRRGCHNINLVTPTHMIPSILKAVQVACQRGLRLPLVYNCGGYERREIIELLEGIVDIYMPDMKFMDGEQSERYCSGASDYPVVAKSTIREMFRQVGPLQTESNGIARHGLMIRHMVMPGHVAGTREFVDWVAKSLSKDVYINIMPQYRPEHKGYNYPQIANATTAEEFREAIRWAQEAGLGNLDKRSLL